MACEICGAIHGLDQHHLHPKRMGGSRNPDVLDDTNLVTLCRTCHNKIHRGQWELRRSESGIQVIDRNGEQVMRRHYNPQLDPSDLFQLLNLVEDAIARLQEAIPYLTDDQLVEAFAYASSLSKRSWLVQAVVLYEAQQRSIYGDRSLEAIARRFEISLRQAHKYALVWKVFFAREPGEEMVNVDEILLDQPSWYVVAASETKDPEQWLAYAQDRKAEDPRYSVSALRRDIQETRIIAGCFNGTKSAAEPAPIVPLPTPDPSPTPRGSKRCSNRRLLASGFRFTHPSYREGYRSMISP